MVAKNTALPIHTRRFRPAQERTIIFKLVGGDYYHVPVSQVGQICPELEATADDAVEDGTAMTHVFEVPRELEGRWKNWWTVNDYIVQDCELNTYEPMSSFLTDANVYILATRCAYHAGAEAAVAATQDRAAEILDCMTDPEITFDQHAALFHLESLIAAARLACTDWVVKSSFTSDVIAAEGSAGVTRLEDGRMALRSMIIAACVTLGPLMAELPALRRAVFEDTRFATLWERVSGGGLEPSWFTPMVKDRMQRVIEGRDIVDSVWCPS